MAVRQRFWRGTAQVPGGSLLSIVLADPCDRETVVINTALKKLTWRQNSRRLTSEVSSLCEFIRIVYVGRWNVGR